MTLRPARIDCDPSRGRLDYEGPLWGPWTLCRVARKSNLPIKAPTAGHRDDLQFWTKLRLTSDVAATRRKERKRAELSRCRAVVVAL